MSGSILTYTQSTVEIKIDINIDFDIYQNFTFFSHGHHFIW
jgi:hypothetical protein